jgi:ATP adenylyltransferase
VQERTGAGPEYPGDDAVTDDFGLAGVPDAFQRLWTPHRMAYIKGGQHQFKNQDDCPFCVAPERQDEDSLIVYRGRTSYVVLNLFPYNPGHLLVCPYRHIPDNQGLTGGAGVAGHLHQHVVPRWGGDGNFFPIIAQTKAITQTLGEVRQQVAEAWPQASGAGRTSAGATDAE